MASSRVAGLERIRLERDGALTVLSLDHPPRNLFDERMFAEFLAAVEALAAGPPRGLLVRAEGPLVSAGVDVHFFDGLSAEGATALAEAQLRAIDLLESLPAPTVFAAHGLTLTAAFEIALACDLIVAAPGARFGLVERVVGLTPLMGGTQRLAARAGSGRARSLVMGGGLFGAEELLSWGVVDRVLPAAEFAVAARRLAAELAAGPTLAHAMTKRVMRSYRDGGVAAGDATASEGAASLFASEDFRRAVEAFLRDGPGADVAFRGK